MRKTICCVSYGTIACLTDTVPECYLCCTPENEVVSTIMAAGSHVYSQVAGSTS